MMCGKTIFSDHLSCKAESSCWPSGAHRSILKCSTPEWARIQTFFVNQSGWVYELLQVWNLPMAEVGCKSGPQRRHPSQYWWYWRRRCRCRLVCQPCSTSSSAQCVYYIIIYSIDWLIYIYIYIYTCHLLKFKFSVPLFVWCCFVELCWFVITLTTNSITQDKTNCFCSR